MANKSVSEFLSELLQQAGLVSSAQIEIALRDRSKYGNLQLGEILALRGWLKLKTVNFFLEHFPELTNQKVKQPLGQYLKQAGLLNEEQIRIILKLQQQTGMLFGCLAVRQGWVKQSTINFFLHYLLYQNKSDSKLKSNQMSDPQKITNITYSIEKELSPEKNMPSQGYLSKKAELGAEAKGDDIPWIG
ncbi:MAG: hypothetical protein AB4038_09760 [Prochloraceae cyanobacterium]